MKILVSVLLAGAAVAAAAAVAATEPKVIAVWPGAAPGSESWNYEERETIGPQDTTRRVSNVTHPTITAYIPDAPIATGTAVVICPGGGFRWLSVDNEGADVARWLNSIGVAAFVLKYRLMRTEAGVEMDRAKIAEGRKIVEPMALADGQQAMRLVRAHAGEWGISKDRIGIIGFSAGGFVASGVALQHDAESRPDFAAPIYPDIPENVTPPADAAPLFLVHANDDKSVTPFEHSVRLYEAWKKAGVSAELHIYAQGGHGFGMRKRGLPVDTWPERFRDWLGAQGLLKPAH